MGLTCVVVELALTLRRVESDYIDGARLRARNLDEALERFESADRAYEYSVAWIDCLSGKESLGRSVLSVGNFAARDALAAGLGQAPLRVRQKGRVAVPFNLPNFALGPAVVRAFNHAYYLTHREAARTVTDYESFFYPLDSIHDWNRIYGRRGFVQYQCVWPEAQSRAGLIEALEAISQSRRGSFLAVLKKFGAQEGMLSFPMAGYTLALDFPLSPGLLGFLDRLDEMVVKRGGRVYLAKDARMRPEVFGAMYPRLGEWRAVKAKVDANNRFASTLSRRLGLLPA
jgi:decaprenylphospho-beta-D-ribofuranose 2-oxidase